MSAGAARARVLELLDLVHLRDAELRLAAYPHQLSGGQRQRVMIAMALANDPDLLIADEPTTALDVTIQAQILELLRELRDRLGMALLLITHDLGIVRKMADRVYVMNDGRIVETGTTAAVFAAPQHEYTRHLLSAAPGGNPGPVAGGRGPNDAGRGPQGLVPHSARGAAPHRGPRPGRGRHLAGSPRRRDGWSGGRERLGERRPSGSPC